MGPLMINMAFMPLYMWEMWDITPVTDTRTVESSAVFSLSRIRNYLFNIETYPGNLHSMHFIKALLKLISKWLKSVLNDFCTWDVNWREDETEFEIRANSSSLNLQTDYRLWTFPFPILQTFRWTWSILDIDMSKTRNSILSITSLNVIKWQVIVKVIGLVVLWTC